MPNDNVPLRRKDRRLSFVKENGQNVMITLLYGILYCIVGLLRNRNRKRRDRVD
jgi:hypothetical protein